VGTCIVALTRTDGAFSTDPRDLAAWLLLRVRSLLTGASRRSARQSKAMHNTIIAE
jgi:hypothetical protein